MTSSEYFFLDSYHNLKEYQGHEWLKIESALQNKSEIPYTYLHIFRSSWTSRPDTPRIHGQPKTPRFPTALEGQSRFIQSLHVLGSHNFLGVVSVFLAMASLAVGIAQAYASFKALG